MPMYHSTHNGFEMSVAFISGYPNSPPRKERDVERHLFSFVQNELGIRKGVKKMFRWTVFLGRGVDADLKFVAIAGSR